MDDVVLLKEDGIVPTQWPTARIIEVHPALVRVATVKTAKETTCKQNCFVTFILFCNYD